MLLVSIAFSVFEYLLAGMLGADPDGFVLIAMAGYSLIAIYVIGRIGPSFAALSVDQPLGLGAAWQATRGEGSRIFVIYLLVSLGWFAVAFLFSSIAQILGLGEAAPYALLFINAVLSAGFLALLVTINSILFRQLSGWRPRQPFGERLMAVEVKICGLNSADAVAAAVENGARHLGFDFYPPSPRAIDGARAAELGRAVPAGITKVGLFVDAGDETIAEVLAQPRSTCCSSMATRPRAGSRISAGASACRS